MPAARARSADRRRLRTVLAAAVLGLVLAGCGSGSSTTGTAPATSPAATGPATSAAAPGTAARHGNPALTFRPVLFELGPGQSAPDPRPRNVGDSVLVDPAPVGTAAAAVLPLRPTAGAADVRYGVGPVAFDGTGVERAEARLDPTIQQWLVPLLLLPGADGLDRFNRAASACFHRDASCPTGQLAVVLDGEVLTAPSIQAERFERDQLQISGRFDEAGARALADTINAS